MEGNIIKEVKKLVKPYKISNEIKKMIKSYKISNAKNKCYYHCKSDKFMEKLRSDMEIVEGVINELGSLPTYDPDLKLIKKQYKYIIKYKEVLQKRIDNR